MGNRVVRWERRDNKVLLRTASFDIMADSSLPIYQAVRAANYSRSSPASTSSRTDQTARP